MLFLACPKKELFDLSKNVVINIAMDEKLGYIFEADDVCNDDELKNVNIHTDGVHV